MIPIIVPTVVPVGDETSTISWALGSLLGVVFAYGLLIWWPAFKYRRWCRNNTALIQQRRTQRLKYFTEYTGNPLEIERNRHV